MATHQFTIVVHGLDLQSDSGANALFAAGCDDATAGRINGVQCVEFDREAVSMDAAIQSAASDLQRLDGLDVVRVSNQTPSSLASG